MASWDPPLPRWITLPHAHSLAEQLGRTIARGTQGGGRRTKTGPISCPIPFGPPTAGGAPNPARPRARALHRLPSPPAAPRRAHLFAHVLVQPDRPKPQGHGRDHVRLVDDPVRVRHQCVVVLRGGSAAPPRPRPWPQHNATASRHTQSSVNTSLPLRGGTQGQWGGGGVAHTPRAVLSAPNGACSGTAPAPEGRTAPAPPLDPLHHMQWPALAWGPKERGCDL